MTESVDVSDLKSAGHCARGGSSPPAPTFKEMYKVRCDYRYINTIGIALVYFINGMPFVYDDIHDEDKGDPYVKAIADSEEPLDIEQLTKNSEYLMIEEMHPMLFPVELDECSQLPN